MMFKSGREDLKELLGWNTRSVIQFKGEEQKTLSFPERYFLFFRHDHHHKFKFERKGWSCNVMPLFVCDPD